MKYIIDTYYLLEFLEGKEEVVKKIISLPADEWFITIFNHSEMMYILNSKNNYAYNLHFIKEFLKKFQILEFDKRASNVFAKIKWDYNYHDLELLKISIALVNNAFFVSNKEYKVKGLKLLNINP
jgi:predicted nucleic acid-binding protein